MDYFVGGRLVVYITDVSQHLLTGKSSINCLSAHFAIWFSYRIAVDSSVAVSYPQICWKYHIVVERL